ncbi:UDP-glucose 6-dehydrogenase [Phlyctema vagabunda]|uniref:UDP-glucose 6-dehydrogenase n=1 Tax=Phlyctema vagabunda TaxID=108571 RepID=A0ABR4P3A6_9HELO
MSTAPTTPDGSLTFSPILQAMRIQDALEDAPAEQKLRSTSISLDATLYSSTPKLKKICCVGAGYVGGPTAAVMAFQNPSLDVTVVDRDISRIKQWQTRHLPIYEPGLVEIVRIARDGTRAFSISNKNSGIAKLDKFTGSCSSSDCESQYGDDIYVPARVPNLFFSTEVSKHIATADIVLIAVNTPTKAKGIGSGRATDVTALEAVTREVALHAKPGTIVVEKSTVPCRTADIIRDTLAVHRPEHCFEVLSNPEFLAAGTAINDLLAPDRVVIGSSPTPSGIIAAEALASVYASWVPRSRIVTMNTWSSELSKLVANSMLAQRVSSINTISAVCERTGADINEVAYSIGLDPRIGSQFLKAGLGFGGSCFKKDILSLVYLAESLGLEEVAEYWQQVVAINESQLVRFGRRIIKCLNGTLVGKKLSVLGYAFKKNTDDTRESPALELIKLLLEDAPAEIAVFDPCCEPFIVKAEIKRLLGRDGRQVLREEGGSVEVYGDPYEACLNSNAIITATDCDEFRNTSNNSSLSRPPVHLDPRPFGRLEPTELKLLALHKHLSSTSQDPLQRFSPEPECEVSCTHSYKENLDWTRVAEHMQKPKWVFDGRGILDTRVMQALGVRVEAIGKVGWTGL